VNERILVLDDETSILEILGQHLSEEAYEVDLFTSPVKALERLEHEKYDLLITDLKMPGIHGIEVVQRSRALDRDLAVIVVTALLDVTNAIEAMRAGADDYLLKPFNLTEISLAVEKALERRRLYIENREYQETLERRVAEATEGLQALNRELEKTKDYLENLLNSSVDTILTVDRSGTITYVNRGMLEMFGYTPADLVDTPVSALLHGGEEEFQFIRRAVEKGAPLQNYETEIAAKDGRKVPINMSLSLVRDSAGKLISTLAICKDITEQKRLEAELKEMSIKDSLTGLYNQRYFYDKLESEIERARRQGHPLSLVLFDVDQFKPYNDKHGHLEGDRVLRTVGQVVVESTREHVDLGFRYGGDEFTVILPEADEKEAYTIAERIRAAFEAKHFDDLTLSVGVMSYQQGTSLKSFIRYADAVMYDAKREGGNRVYVYSAAGSADGDGRPEPGGAPA